MTHRLDCILVVDVEASSFGQAIGLVKLQIRLGDLLQHAIEPLAAAALAALAALLDAVQGAQRGNKNAGVRQDLKSGKDVSNGLSDGGMIFGAGYDVKRVHQEQETDRKSWT